MARLRNRNKVNATGRNPTSRFARLDFRLLHSNAYRSLSPNARSLLVELVSLHNGDNNGSLYLSVRDGAHRMGVADLTAATRAFDDLRALGFIELTQDAHFGVKAAEKSRARCWRLTWEAGPGAQRPFDGVSRPGTSAAHPRPQTDGTRASISQKLPAGKVERQSTGIGFRYASADCTEKTSRAGIGFQYGQRHEWRKTAKPPHSGFRHTYSCYHG